MITASKGARSLGLQAGLPAAEAESPRQRALIGLPSVEGGRASQLIGFLLRTSFGGHHICVYLEERGCEVNTSNTLQETRLGDWIF